MASEPPSEIDYEQRIVAFIDILGFESFVTRADKDISAQAKIIQALRKIKGMSTNADGQGGSGLRAQNFSDSIILSANNTPDGFWHLVLEVNSLSWNLLSEGILIRGAITVGNIYHDDDIVFGKGVNEAYRLETNIARVPRIMLSQTAVAAANQWHVAGGAWESYKDKFLMRSSDGVWFVHVLADLRNWRLGGEEQIALIEQCNLFTSVVQGMIDETVESPNIYEKIKWLAIYLNWSLEHQYGTVPAKPLRRVHIPGGGLEGMP